MARRDNLDLTAEILQIAQRDTNKTGIVYGVKLNFKSMDPYIHNLLTTGLLTQNEKGKYRTTEKGFEFLENYQNLKKPFIV